MLKLPDDHPHTNGRECTTCNKHKAANEFKLEIHKKYGIRMRSKCRICDEHRKYKRFIFVTYGITWEEYTNLLIRQNHSCAICDTKISSKRTTKLFVDHCHDTGKVRGLLCSCCNHGLGQFKDDVGLLEKAKLYLITSRD